MNVFDCSDITFNDFLSLMQENMYEQITDLKSMLELDFEFLVDEDILPIFVKEENNVKQYIIPSNEEELEFLLSDLNSVNEIYLIEKHNMSKIFPEFVDGL